MIEMHNLRWEILNIKLWQMRKYFDNIKMQQITEHEMMKYFVVWIFSCVLSDTWPDFKDCWKQQGIKMQFLINKFIIRYELILS